MEWNAAEEPALMAEVVGTVDQGLADYFEAALMALAAQSHY